MGKRKHVGGTSSVRGINFWFEATIGHWPSDEGWALPNGDESADPSVQLTCR